MQDSRNLESSLIFNSPMKIGSEFPDFLAKKKETKVIFYFIYIRLLTKVLINSQVSWKSDVPLKQSTSRHFRKVPSSTVDKKKSDMSELLRRKDRSKVIINVNKRKDSGTTFSLKTSNRFNVLKSDDDELDIKNSSDGLLCGELTTSTRKIVEVGDPLTKNKVISANKL